MNKSRWLLAALAAALCWAACKKDDDTTTLHVRMTDGPGDFQQVNIDIQQIRIKTSQDTAQWITLQTNAGVYNLLDFQNGIDTLLATGTVPAVTLKEVRFVLGPNNSVVVAGATFPIETPSAEESGLKVKIDRDLNLDLNTLVLDFDAAASIVLQGNGTYRLKPVIKVK